MRLCSIAALLLLGMSAAFPAYAVEAVRNTADLSSDRKVQELYPDFSRAVRSNVIYKFCQDTFVFTPEQLAFQKEAFDTLEEKYLRGFYDAYIRRVGYPPNKIVTDNYTKYIYAQEAKIMKEMVDQITKSKCDNGRVVRIMNFIETLRYEKMAAQGKLPAENAAQTATPATTTPPTATPGSQ